MEKCKFTTSLNREIASLKELVFIRIGGIEKAVELSHSDYVRVPTDIQKEIKALKEFLLAKLDGEHELKEVKFAKVEQRFDLIERARLEQKSDTQIMVNAALTAQERAFAKQNESFLLSINKSEESTTKQIEAQGKIITDLKDRLTRIEGSGSGASKLWAVVAGLILLAIAIASYFKN